MTLKEKLDSNALKIKEQMEGLINENYTYESLNDLSRTTMGRFHFRVRENTASKSKNLYQAEWALPIICEYVLPKEKLRAELYAVLNIIDDEDRFTVSGFHIDGKTLMDYQCIEQEWLDELYEDGGPDPSTLAHFTLTSDCSKELQNAAIMMERFKTVFGIQNPNPNNCIEVTKVWTGYGTYVTEIPPRFPSYVINNKDVFADDEDTLEMINKLEHMPKPIYEKDIADVFEEYVDDDNLYDGWVGIMLTIMNARLKDKKYGVSYFENDEVGKFPPALCVEQSELCDYGEHVNAELRDEACKFLALEFVKMGLMSFGEVTGITTDIIWYDHEFSKVHPIEVEFSPEEKEKIKAIQNVHKDLLFEAIEKHGWTVQKNENNIVLSNPDGASITVENTETSTSIENALIRALEWDDHFESCQDLRYWLIMKKMVRVLGYYPVVGNGLPDDEDTYNVLPELTRIQIVAKKYSPRYADEFINEWQGGKEAKIACVAKLLEGTGYILRLDDMPEEGECDALDEESEA